MKVRKYGQVGGWRPCSCISTCYARDTASRQLYTRAVLGWKVSVRVVTVATAAWLRPRGQVYDICPLVSRGEMSSTLEAQFRDVAGSEAVGPAVLTKAGLRTLSVRLLCSEGQENLGVGDDDSDGITDDEDIVNAMLEDIRPASIDAVTFNEFERWWQGLAQEVAEQENAANPPRESEYQVRQSAGVSPAAPYVFTFA